MIELFEASFSGLNVVYTTLLLLALVYWLIVLLGVLDLDAFDIDVDVGDGGIDVSGGADGIGEVDGGLEGETGAAGGFSWLAFFNVGEAPLMFFVSIVFLSMWVVSVQINHAIDTYGPAWMNDYQGWIAAAMALPNLVFSLFLAKLVLEPWKRYRSREPQRTRIVGKVAVVTTEQADEKFGRCEMAKEDGSLILNVRTRAGEALQKGDPVEILEHAKDGREEYYLVTKKIWDE